MQFTKDPKTPEEIPQNAIDQAVELMKSGLLFRYNFHTHLNEYSEKSALDNELASQVAQLEDEFSRYIGHNYVVGVNSCGSALFLSLKAAGVQYQDKVFTNAFTFTAVPSSIVHAGGIPVYLECNHQYVVDVEHFKSQIEANPDVKFFILSHMRGHIADMATIEALCDEAGIYLIEDCAHSLGAKWIDEKTGEERLIGHFGRIACFSSQSHKLLNSGEGGLISTNDEKAAAYCTLAAGSYEYLYKKHIARPYNDALFEELKLYVPNFSLRMSNLTASVLRAQIPTLPERIEQYNQRYRQLERILSSCDNIYVPSPIPQTFRVGDSIQFNLLNLTTEQVDQFLKQTKERGVRIGIFGRLDNARYFRNWRYSFDEVPSLAQTEQIISFACDLRLSLSFNADDINLLGYIIKDVLYRIVSQGNKDDYAEELTDQFHGLSEVISKYDAWASHYDEEHDQNGWKMLLNHVAYTLLSYVNGDDNILELGCGTGLFGRELHSYNFRNLYALDISQKSLAVSRSRKIYQELYRAPLGGEMEFDDNSFGALVSTGVFTRNQVPLTALDELIRILKPGGILALVFRVEDDDFYYKPLKEYCAQNVLHELLKTPISALQTSNHDLVVLQKV